MAYDKEKNQRKVFILPTELVERVGAFQAETGLMSEAEAVRRLLDEALKARDTYKTLIERFLVRLKEVRFLSDAAGILLGHPQVTGMQFDKESLTFTLTNGFECKIEANGNWGVWDQDRNEHDRFPPRERQTFGRSSSPKLDDDIPF